MSFDWKRLRVLMAGAIIGLTFQTPLLAAEEHMVDATATWEGRGQFYQVGTEMAVFVGAFSGSLFVHQPEGLVHGGNLACPGIVEIDLANGKVSGSGRCVIAGEPGERLYATWTCEGVAGQGCDGIFTLTEGTGQWEGVSGSGPFSSRSDFHTLAVTAGNVVSQSMRGLMVWRDFRYTLP